jgi:hypothetical protein
MMSRLNIRPFHAELPERPIEIPASFLISVLVFIKTPS